MTTKTYDVIVIGGGIAGASVAARLAAHASVLLVEMEERAGYHTTGRSAARYEPNYGPDGFVAFSKASGEFFRTPPQGFTDAPLLSKRACVVIAPEDQASEAQGFLKADSSVTEVSEAEAIAMLPVLRRGFAKRFFVDTRSGDLDVDLLHQGFLRMFKQRGGEVSLDAEVKSLNRKNGAWQVDTKAGTFAGATVVNAAGAWCDVVAARAGVEPIGLTPKRRSIGVVPIDSADLMDWPMVTDVGETFYAKPQGGKLLVSSADATPVEPHDAWADDEAIAIGIDRLMHATTLDITRLEHSWGGLRTFTKDKNPAIGFDPDAEGFFWLAGQGGYGIQSSPAVSETAAALVQHQPVPDYVLRQGLDPAMINPERFRK